MDKLEKELLETKNIRRTRAELMRRLRDGKNGKKYKLQQIADLYGCNRQFVYQEIKWLESVK